MAGSFRSNRTAKFKKLSYYNLLKRICIAILILLLARSLVLSKEYWPGKIEFFVSDLSGHTVIKRGKNSLLIPASTLKIATGMCALELLGKNFRFRTDFYLDKEENLYIKGFGDPFLVSEEVERVCNILKRMGIKKIRNIFIDSTLFNIDGPPPGADGGRDPYQALNSAFAVNFNSVSLKITKKGRIFSGERQTPLTSCARRLAKLLKRKGRFRVAFKDPKRAMIHGGEIFKYFFQKIGVRVYGRIGFRKLPQYAVPITIFSSFTLEQLLQKMLYYSNNFMANQILLYLGAVKLSPPSNYQRGAYVLSKFLRERIGWHKFRVVAGSGLSRENRVRPSDMVKLLKFFYPQKFLLPKKYGVYAKTGTLKGLQTLAAYVPTKKGTMLVFFSYKGKGKRDMRAWMVRKIRRLFPSRSTN